MHISYSRPGEKTMNPVSLAKVTEALQRILDTESVTEGHCLLVIAALDAGKLDGKKSKTSFLSLLARAQGRPLGTFYEQTGLSARAVDTIDLYCTRIPPGQTSKTNSYVAHLCLALHVAIEKKSQAATTRRNPRITRGSDFHHSIGGLSGESLSMPT